MTREEWDQRYEYWVRYVAQKYPNTPAVEQWRIARRLTVEYAGPRPPEGGPPLRVKLVLLWTRLVKGKVAMDKVLAVWSFLNGKKTAVGAFLTLIADMITMLLPQLGVVLGAFGVDAATVALVVGILGKILIVIGLFHKLVKVA